MARRLAVHRIERELAAQRSAPPVQYVAPQVPAMPQPADAWYAGPTFYPGVVFPSVVIVRPKQRFFFPRTVHVRHGFHSFHSFHPMRR